MRGNDANRLIRAVGHVDGARRSQHGHILRIDELSLARHAIVGTRTAIARQCANVACMGKVLKNRNAE
jgi:hypothetical protein